jgi:hypothetical protein
MPQLIRNREIFLASPGVATTGGDRILLDPPVQGAQALVILEGIDVQFANRNDHHLGRLSVNWFADIADPTTVNVTATGALRDWSGGDDDVNGDDPFSIRLDFSVLIV